MIPPFIISKERAKERDGRAKAKERDGRIMHSGSFVVAFHPPCM